MSEIQQNCESILLQTTGAAFCQTNYITYLAVPL